MCNRKAINIVHFLDSDVEIAVEDCDLWRSSYKLNESVH